MSSRHSWQPGRSSTVPPPRSDGFFELPGSTANRFDPRWASGRRRPPPVPPAASPPAPPIKKFIAVGIDFGTTFSGVAWAYSRDPDRIHEVQQWPCLGLQEREKDEVQVPTQIDLETQTWGFKIPPNANPIRWFKLLLLQDRDLKPELLNSPCLQDARKQVARLGSDAVIDLIADFLSYLWEHTCREIALEMGADNVEALPFRVALTIPAIWPQYSRTMMKEAARRAKILKGRDIGETSLTLVEEPEAAALATLFERMPYPDVKPGETFIVCDCGGGTVDIISYKIIKTEPFVVREVVKGDGRLCGAFLIDEAFERHMREDSGLKFSRCESPTADFRSFVNAEWELTMKRVFTGDDFQDDYHIKPPLKAFSRMARLKGTTGEYTLKRDTIKAFFATTDQGTSALIAEQQDKILRIEGKPPKRILLVGGLGASRYLYKQLQGRFGNVVQPKRAWSAVARGAVIKVLRGSFSPNDLVTATDPRLTQLLLRLPEVDERISRLSYGVESGIPITRAYPPLDRVVDRTSVDPDGGQVVWRMKWYLRQGDPISNRDPVTFTFYEYIATEATRHTSFKILVSDNEEPPVRKDASVRALCTINCEYDRPFGDLPLVDPRRNIRRMDGMNLTMRFDGEPQWMLQVGRNMIEKRVDVQFPDAGGPGRQPSAASGIGVW